MRAVILAGGAGTRLRPYTTVLPKPLMPVGDRPILDVIMRQLRRHGFERVTIATGYLAELIEAFVGDGARYDVAVDYLREDEPLGTAGGLALIGDLDEPFLVMNGDVLTDIDYGRFLKDHRASDATATIAATHRAIQVTLGVLEFGEADDTRLTGYVEKPSFEYEVSMGVYAFEPDVPAHIDAGSHLDFPDLVQRLLAAGKTVRAWRSDAYWLDIGRPEDYERAQEEFEQMAERLLPGGY
jgi:NDP-sugar pyrophosphorylase family protein